MLPKELTNLKIWLEETTGCKDVGNAKQRVESWAKTFDSQNEIKSLMIECEDLEDFMKRRTE